MAKNAQKWPKKPEKGPKSAKNAQNSLKTAIKTVLLFFPACRKIMAVRVLAHANRPFVSDRIYRMQKIDSLRLNFELVELEGLVYHSFVGEL